MNRELHRRLRSVANRILERDERAIQDAVPRAALNLSETLPLLWGEGGDEVQADDVPGLARGVRDHRTCVGVADREHGAWNPVEEARDVGGVMRDAAQRIRGCCHLHDRSLQAFDHAVPARSVGEGAVDENGGERCAVAGWP